MDKKIELVKRTLLEKLIQFPCSPDEQKIIIEYLYSIGFNDFNAGWYCLEQEKHWIIQLIIECRDLHIADEKVSLVMKASDKDHQNDDTTNANAMNTSTSGVSNSTSNAANISALVNGATVSQTATTATGSKSLPIQPHERNKFIEELCEMILDLFTDYWRLGNMYTQGHLLPKTDDEGKSSKKIKNLKAPSVEEFHNLVREILTTFSNIVRVAFIPQTMEKLLSQDEKYKQLFTQWPVQHDAKITSQILPHCLRVCR